MRSHRFVAVVAGLLLELAAASLAHAQPRPSDAEPLDFVPPSVSASSTPAAPSLLPAPDSPATTSVPANPYGVSTPVYVPPAASFASPATPPSFSAAPSYGSAEMPPEISPYVDKSRYLSYGGRWWYLQPGNHWTYWSEGRWVDYQPSRYSNTPAYVQPPGNPRRWNRILSGAPVVVPPAAAYRPQPVPAFPAGGY